MAEKNKSKGAQDSVNRGGRQGSHDSSIGNQQGTAQTGGQNAGGRNRDVEDDKFTDDLRQSGNRKSRDEEGGNRGS
jgi:hypothetical protein